MALLYFEKNGPALLKRMGVSKAEFARKMGIQRQNVNVLFKTKNLATIHKAAIVLGVPFELLVGYTSEPELIPGYILLKDDLIPVAFGPFGCVYEDFRGKPKEAFWFLIDHQEGDLRGVFKRAECGDIDLVWGDENCGVCHILLKHINKKDFPTVTAMIERITDLIINGTTSSLNTDVLVIRKQGYSVIIRRNYRQEGKKPEPKNWVLTAYNKDSSDTTLAPLGVD